ncbi:hypothetical protein C1645_829263 [Glomus cerebriforme]|uniref:Uncharacterized protein n=1 Tax=Glomus cerebriforme TaxID=658196 RepID=A0A397SPA7_9GLOM|nr:hypothetical protein C1645_829263 [Glomus cerebriforme]
MYTLESVDFQKYGLFTQLNKVLNNKNTSNKDSNSEMEDSNSSFSLEVIEEEDKDSNEDEDEVNQVGDKSNQKIFFTTEKKNSTIEFYILSE